MSSELRAQQHHAEAMAKQCRARADRLSAYALLAADNDMRALAESDAARASLDAGLWSQLAAEIRSYLDDDHPEIPETAGALW